MHAHTLCVCVKIRSVFAQVCVCVCVCVCVLVCRRMCEHEGKVASALQVDGLHTKLMGQLRDFLKDQGECNAWYAVFVCVCVSGGARVYGCVCCVFVCLYTSVCVCPYVVYILCIYDITAVVYMILLRFLYTCMYVCACRCPIIYRTSSDGCPLLSLSYVYHHERQTSA